MKCISTLDNFKNKDLTFYYWLGFLLADGHFSNNRLNLTLGKKDKDHVQKLADYLKINYRETGRGLPYLSVMNKKIIGKYIKEFDLNPNKTKNPPQIKYYKNLSFSEIKSILIGFVDGDGSVQFQTNRKTNLIKIKCHKSWIKFLTYFCNFLDIGSEPYINKKDYCVFNISSHIQCLGLKKFIEFYNIPHLQRKWDKVKKIDLRTSTTLKYRVLVLLKKGYRNIDIKKKLGVSNPYISELKFKYCK